MLLDYDRPVFFIAVAVGKSAQYLRLVPLQIPPEDLHNSIWVAISRIATVTMGAGNLPRRQLAGLSLRGLCRLQYALWALANNPAGYQHLVEAAANLVSLLEDREISLTAGDLVEPHNLLQTAVHEVRL